MIKTTLKLLIALAILNAVARTGMVAWRYYELRDEAQQLITFGARVSTTELSNRILTKATELEIPLEPQDIDVHREGNRTFANAAYSQPVELFPTFIYPIDLSFSVDTFAIPSGK